MIFFKHRRSAERDAFSVPRSVQKSIPIKRIYQDGVFQVSGKFSKTWRFFDVNYAVASPEKQRELFCSPLTGVTSDSWDTPAGHRVYDACRGFSVSWVCRDSGASSASSTSC